MCVCVSLPDTNLYPPNKVVLRDVSQTLHRLKRCIIITVREYFVSAWWIRRYTSGLKRDYQTHYYRDNKIVAPLHRDIRLLSNLTV